MFPEDQILKQTKKKKIYFNVNLTLYCQIL